MRYIIIPLVIVLYCIWTYNFYKDIKKYGFKTIFEWDSDDYMFFSKIWFYMFFSKIWFMIHFVIVFLTIFYFIYEYWQ